MKRSYLEKVYFKKKTPDSFKKLKKTKELLQQTLQKRAEKIFRKS